MALNSKIVITFIKDPVDTDDIFFERDDGVSTIVNLETYQDSVRFGKDTIEIKTPTGTPGESAAISFEELFALDHNASGIYTITRAVEVVTIEMSPNWQFQNFTSSGALATKVITTGIPQTYVLTSADIEEASTAICNLYGVAIVTSEETVSWTLDLFQTNITPATDFSIDLTRLFFINGLILKNAGGDQINLTLAMGIPHLYGNKMFPILNLDINVLNTPNGATVSVIMNFPNQGQPQPDSGTTWNVLYSLDDISYFGLNGAWDFTGIANGSYTMYAKQNNTNCKMSKDFEVTASGTKEPYMFISKTNSVGFSKVEIWDGYDINKNDENLLSCNSLAKQVYQEKVLYQENDFITIQFKSNYETVLAFFIEDDDTSNALTVVKKSNNLNRFESLDCTIYNAGNNQLGIFFTSGDRYNEAEAVIGQYELDGNLPDFAIIGLWISITTVGAFEIKDIIFDAENNRKAIIINFAYTGVEVDRRCDATFNLLDFEVYEFDVDFAIFTLATDPSNDIDFLEGRLRILVDDPVLTLQEFFSETILIQVEHPFSIKIDYWNNNNRDVFYIYGIRHMIRISYLEIIGFIEDEVDISINDLTNVINESTLTDGNTFKFDAVTRNVMLKLSIALSCKNLFINDLGYIKKDSLEIKNIINTNLYEIVAELLKTNINFNINSQGQIGVNRDFEIANVAKVLKTGAGLIKT